LGNHCLISFEKYKEKARKIIENNNPQVPKVSQSMNFFVRKNGVTIPAESQATALLTKNSDITLLWPREKVDFLIF